MSRTFNDTEGDDRNIQQLINKGNNRLCIINICWSVITMPFIFFIPKNNVVLFLFCYLIWVFIGILLSLKISNKIWKN